MALFAKKKNEAGELATTSSHTHHYKVSLIKQPHVTEKSLRLTHDNQYVFVVDPVATKQEIKKQIHTLYHVDVTQVRSLSKERTKSWRGTTSGTQRFKKMIVTIKEGQKIDMTANV